MRRVPLGTLAAVLWIALVPFSRPAVAVVVPEQESQNDTCPGQLVPCGALIQPALLENYTDYDYYAFSVTAGTPITVGTDDPGGYPFSDTVIELMNAACSQLYASDDNSGPRNYSLISGFVAPYTGTYVLRVHSGSTSLPQPYMAFVYCGPPPLGACCLSSGACQLRSRVQCEAQNAEYWGDGSTCSQVACAPAPANDRCESAVQIPVPGQGNLSGDTFYAANDYEPNFPSCTGGPNGGGDVVYRMELSPGDILQVSYTQAGADGTIYLVTDCADPEQSCVAGVDATGWGQPETLTYTVGTPPTGACCYQDYTCVVLTEQACTAGGGIWRGIWTTCDPNYCYLYAGACCLPDGSCIDSNPWECAQLGGEYAGDGVQCYWQPCPQPPGACCFAGGSCLMLDGQNCLLQSGYWLGEGVACDPNPCAGSFGACCFADQSCHVRSPEECAAQGGVYQGDLVRCEAPACGATLGPCCITSGYCVMVTETQCDEMHGSWLGGLAPTCNPNPCPASAPASGPSSPPAAPQSDRQTFYLVLDSRYVGTGGPWTLSYQVWQAGDAPEEGLAAASGPTVEVAPNPFASLTRITYGVAGSFSGSVRAEIFDPAGRLIRSLPAARGASGSISWDGRNERGDRAAAGVYFLRLHAGATAITRPLILID